MATIIPVSGIVPTRNRMIPLKRMLWSLAEQSTHPAEIIVVDGSSDEETELLCTLELPGLRTKIIYQRAQELGAAVQRQQALHSASQEIIWFLDDDILFEQECVSRLWRALYNDPKLGGVNAMIVNQKYTSPGTISRLLYQTLHGREENSYAGKCIGPAYNLLPEDRSDLPEVVSVEWLNSGCTLYRREALPSPLFPSIFTGYSLMEDLTLSLVVGKKWKLANARTARIFHDSQPGDHKANVAALAKMELINRHYVMTNILGRTNFLDYLKLILLQLFQLASTVSSTKRRSDLFATLAGKTLALIEISRSSNR